MSDPDDADETAADPEEQPELVAYEDEDAYIVCDRSNPKAWIRSTITMAAEPAAQRKETLRRRP